MHCTAQAWQGQCTPVCFQRLHPCSACIFCLDLQELSDWSQCQVLELVSHYTPANDAEVRAAAGKSAAQEQAVARTAFKAEMAAVVLCLRPRLRFTG
jgi:myo-inositol catabolism protein IolC